MHHLCERCYKPAKLFPVFHLNGKSSRKVCSECKDVLIKICKWEEGKGEKIPSLPIENCSFVALSSVLALIKSKKATDTFINDLNNGDACFGNNNRTLVTIEYIREIMNQNNTASYNKARIALNSVSFSGVEYVDLEN